MRKDAEERASKRLEDERVVTPLAPRLDARKGHFMDALSNVDWKGRNVAPTHGAHQDKISLSRDRLARRSHLPCSCSKHFWRRSNETELRSATYPGLVLYSPAFAPLLVHAQPHVCGAMTGWDAGPTRQPSSLGCENQIYLTMCAGCSRTPE